MRETETIRQGLYELYELIGSGGMGSVYRGAHAAQGREVAIKVLTAERALEPVYQRAFDAEVRAMVRLHHPCIATVYDYGRLSAQAEASSGGQLRAGSPFLVMELANMGTLKDVGPLGQLEGGWGHLTTVLFALLDGLAHAHAKGVIHRDIKPGNVLLHMSEQGGVGLKLTDFGIAHAREDEGEGGQEVATGTPQYMAPEQIRKDRRAQGPWTDLYALGCLAYRLATGEDLFARDNLAAVLRAQLKESPPRLEPGLEAPPGLQAWLDRMLAKSPAHRYNRAADAAHDLMAIERLVEGTSLGHATATSHPLADGRLTVETPTLELDGRLEQALADAGGAAVVARAAYTPGAPPALPSSWRRAGGEASAKPLRGTGVGLFGLRPPPLVGRELERDAMWRTLVEVHATRRPHLVVLSGAAGVGKSRLAEWIGERAHELGGATVLTAPHDPLQGANTGVGRMLASILRCEGLNRREAFKQARALYEEIEPGVSALEVSALVEVIHPSAAPARRRRPTSSELHQLTRGEGLSSSREAVTRVRFASAIERDHTVARFLGLIARSRPIILHIDDAQWGIEALELTRVLLDPSRGPLPVLIVMTALKEEGDEERPSAELEMVDALLEMERSVHIPIQPMSPEVLRALVEHVICLEPSFVERIVERVGGSPLFAVQLLGDWIGRGSLSWTPSGFVPRAGDAERLPDDIHASMRARVERVVTQLESLGIDHGRHVLELAATLGRMVDEGEWRAACVASGVALTEGVEEAALTERLMHRTFDGVWSFTHGMLRECLERLAREGGRWESHNAACVAALSSTDRGQVSLCRRLGRHLIEAGRYTEALDVLLEGVGLLRRVSDYAGAFTLVALRDDAARRLSEGGHAFEGGDLAQVLDENRVAAARTHVVLGNFDAAEAELAHGRRLVGGAPRRVGLEAEVAWIEGTVAQKRASPARARTRLTVARRLYEEAGESWGVANAVYGLGSVNRLEGDRVAARACFEHALELFWGEDSLDGVGMCLSALSDLARRDGDRALARRLIQRAERSFRKAGNRFGVATSLNTHGDLTRFEGELGEAEASYTQAIGICESIGSSSALIYRINLCYVAMLRGRFSEVVEVAEKNLAALQRRGWSVFEPFVHAQLLCCFAVDSRFERWDHHLERIASHLERSHVIDDDLAWPLQLAGDLARNVGQDDRAAFAYRLSLAQWRSCQNDERVREVELLLHNMGASTR